MKNYKTISTYKKQLEVWKSLSRPIWKEDGKRQNSILRSEFVRAFLGAGIELKTQKGDDLSVGRINGHLNALKDHIGALGALNGVSPDKINKWKENVRICKVKDDVEPIEGLNPDEDFFSIM
jgi:hypothetical protein